MHTITPAPKRQVHENPMLGDKAVFLETSRETSGRHTLIEVEVAPGGGTPPHRHTDYTETFIPLEGELKVLVGKEYKLLKPGDSSTVPRHTLHYFQNPGKEPIRFLVKLEPGHEGFENTVKIAYGLARDGQTDSKSMPKKFAHMAILTDIGGTVPGGIFSLLMPLFRWRARRARKQGILRALMERYCQD